MAYEHPADVPHVGKFGEYMRENAIKTKIVIYAVIRRADKLQHGLDHYLIGHDRIENFPVIYRLEYVGQHFPAAVFVFRRAVVRPVRLVAAVRGEILPQKNKEYGPTPSVPHFAVCRKLKHKLGDGTAPGQLAERFLVSVDMLLQRFGVHPAVLSRAFAFMLAIFAENREACSSFPSKMPSALSAHA